jgi:hypothetical protein
LRQPLRSRQAAHTDGAIPMIRTLIGLFFAAFASFFGFLFYDRYWRWRGCFNESGRCFDPEFQDVILEQAGGIYGSIALVCFAAAIALFVRRRRG